MKKGSIIIRKMFPENLDHFRFFQFGHFFDLPKLETENYTIISYCKICGIKRKSTRTEQSYFEINAKPYNLALFSISKRSNGEVKVNNKIITCEDYIIKNILT